MALPQYGTQEYLAAWGLIEVGRKIRNFRYLRSAVPLMFIETTRRRPDLSLVLCHVGFFRGLLLREAFEPLRRRGVRARPRPLWVRIFRRVQTRLGWLFLAFLVPYMEAKGKKDNPRAVGWNDYTAVLWLMTGDIEYVRELHRRATVCVPPVEVVPPVPGAVLYPSIIVNNNDGALSAALDKFASQTAELELASNARTIIHRLCFEHADFFEALALVEAETGVKVPFETSPPS